MVAVAACLSLAACGGTSSGGGAGGGTGGGAMTGISAAVAEQANTTFKDYDARIKAGTLKTTTPTGQATMAGYYGITDNQGAALIGDLSMNVDFGAGTISGSASNFGNFDNSGPTLIKQGGPSGSLTVSGSVTGSAMTATAKGTLSGNTTAAVDTTMTGNFYDDSGTTVAVGNVSGQVTDSGATAPVKVTGSFYAVKQ